MTYLLECKDLTHHYNDPLHHQVCVLMLSFTLEKRTSPWFGESGSGKSTTAKIPESTLNMQKGSIQFLGQSLTTYTDFEFYKKVAIYFSTAPRSLSSQKGPYKASLEEVCQNFKICKTQEGRWKSRFTNSWKGLAYIRIWRSSFPTTKWRENANGCYSQSLSWSSPDLLICDEITSALDVTVQEGSDGPSTRDSE